MTIQFLSNQELKSHYVALFESTFAHQNDESFQLYLKTIIVELSWGLVIDIDLIDKDINDQVVCKSRHLGALESLKRVLLSIAEGANYKATTHPDWSLLAGRIEIQRIKLETPNTFSEMLNKNPKLWNNTCEDSTLKTKKRKFDSDNKAITEGLFPKNRKTSVASERNGQLQLCKGLRDGTSLNVVNYYDFSNSNAEELESMIVPARDYDFYFFGIRTLEKSYLMRFNGDQLLETPQRMYLRIATFLWMPEMDKIKTYYDLMSTGAFTHASPTMFHAGIAKGSLASCFLLSMQDDLEKIFKCLGQCAMISKSAGGIGLDISNIRHSAVGHHGNSSGIVPMLKVYDAGMRYVDQGGRRKGSATIFLQPWHIDFHDFLLLKRQHGKEEHRARDLFYSVWNCDIFMHRVRNNLDWTLFCPKFVPLLKNTFGKEFDENYVNYEKELSLKKGNEKYMKTVSARELWNEILTTQIETGMPFMTNKDTANYTSNQKNLGLIRSSNLCVEIMEVTDENTISSCNLASIALDEYVSLENGSATYDHLKLGRVVRLIIQGLNRVIERTCYPLQEKDSHGNIVNAGPIKNTNLKYRPLGLGVQALADTFLKMNLAWTDDDAKQLNKEIFATIYYHAIDESVELAKKYGKYDGFNNSPASKGLLKFDLIAIEKARKSFHGDYTEKDLEKLSNEYLEKDLSKKYDWVALKNKVMVHGLRNSLLIALMPTASSAQIRYKNESFEPFTTNMYVRSVLAGNHVIVNRYMVNELIQLKIWNKDIVNFIIKNEGSIQKLPLELVKESLRGQLQRLKEKCLTAFELSQKLLVDLSIDRSYYVCQSQSLNIHIKDPTIRQLTSLHFYAWENALSTGMYYLRTAPSTEAIQFTVEGELDVKKSIICTDEICVSCQS